MLAKLALAIFLMVNGAPVGPRGIAVVDHAFPTEQACKEFAASEEGVALAAQVLEFGKAKYGDTAFVHPECVMYDPEVEERKPEERGATLWPEWGNVS